MLGVISTFSDQKKIKEKYGHILGKKTVKLGIQNGLFIDLKRPERCTFLRYGNSGLGLKGHCKFISLWSIKYKMQQPTLDAVVNFS